VRACRVIVLAVILVATVSLAPTASGASLDACAQRVIRDWYSGGRVDKVYPLGCYRAAIRALPADVLQYSDADRDIARALAYARRGRRDPGTKTPQQTPRPAESSDSTAEPSPRAKMVDRPRTSSVPAPAPDRDPDVPSSFASGEDPSAVSSAVPYPVLALAGLAGILLLSGAAGWLMARRR
jgi:hypothetical protein